MSTTQVQSFIEAVGLPAAFAIGAAFLVWVVIKWLMSTVIDKMKELKDEIRVETDKVENQTRDNHTMIVSLVDRVRTMERNLLLFATEMRAVHQIKSTDWHRTRNEKRAELEEQLKDVGSNE